MKEFVRLGKDPERFGQKENAPYKFSIALDGRKKLAAPDKDGNTYGPVWLDVVVFNDTPAFKTIESLAKSQYPLKKGSAIVIDGQFQQEEYEAKDKETGASLGIRTNNVLRAYAIELPKLGSKGGKSESSSGSTEAPTPAGVANNSQAAPASSDDAPGGVAFDI